MSQDAALSAEQVDFLARVFRHLLVHCGGIGVGTCAKFYLLDRELLSLRRAETLIIVILVSSRSAHGLKRPADVHVDLGGHEALARAIDDLLAIKRTLIVLIDV